MTPIINNNHNNKNMTYTTTPPTPFAHQCITPPPTPITSSPHPSTRGSRHLSQLMQSCSVP